MTTIETLIGDLLLRHNCVIVPSFGGFVAKQISAKVDFKSGKMTPPRKSLLFNKQLINNDGLLINELAQANGCSFDVASNEVREKVEIWNTSLKSGNRIELDRVGFLFLDDERNLCFEQDRFFNLLLASFGLGQVHFLSAEDVKIVEQKVVEIKPLEQQEEKIQLEKEEPVQKMVVLPVNETVVKEIKVFEHPEVKKQRSGTWKYIAAACFLPITFYSIWIPVKTDVLESGVISLKDFNPFKQKTQEFYKAPTQILTKEEVKEENQQSLSDKIDEVSNEVDVYTYKFDEDFFVPVKIKSTELETQLDQAPNNSDENFSVENVHYIVGCFSDKNNADNLVQKLKSQGLMAKIVDVHNGLHRVSAGGAVSVEGLNDIKMTANSIGLSGWILK